jgi:hypothetical protein
MITLPIIAMVKGPPLEQYVETRLNLLTKMIVEQSKMHTEALAAFAEASKASLAAAKAVAEAAQAATDLRYQQRFEAQSDALAAAFLSQQTAMQTAFVVAEKAVQAALAAADRAVSKAELAADKRFESVNEFRKTLDDQQRTLMPRNEAGVMVGALADKVSALKLQVEGSIAEHRGIQGGWGYAVGVVGFLLALGALIVMGIKFIMGK